MSYNSLNLSMTKPTLLNLTKAFIYASFFVPLVVIPSSYIFPFIVPKILLFRSLAILMSAGLALLLITNWEEFKLKPTPINIGLAGFLLSFAISTFVGVDAYHSFWDNHERMLGLFTILHYVLYYAVATAVLKNWTDWKWALRIFLIAGSMVMFVGILQVGNPNLLLNQGSDRIASTLGNAIYVGGYGLFLIFVAFLLCVKNKSLVWLWVTALLGVLALFGMFYSGTRGSMLGLLAGIGVLLVGYTLTFKEHRGARKILIGLMVAAVVAVGVLYYYRATSFVRSLPAIGRAVNTSFSDVKSSARWVAWEIAVQSWKERPVFGWGPNNFFYAFNKHYNPRSLEFGYGETWFDNAHNIIVNTLTVQGAVGLAVYLLLFAIAIFVSIRAFRRGVLDRHVAIVGTAFLVAHLVQNITVFENPTSYLYFMFWLAMINSLTVNKTNQPLPKNSVAPIAVNKKISNTVVGIFGAVAVVLILIFNYLPAQANQKTLSLLRIISSSPANAASEITKILDMSSPHIDDIRSDTARLVSQAITDNDRLTKDQKTSLFNAIYPALLKNLTLHPLDIRTHLLLSQLTQTMAIMNQDPRYMQESESYLTEAVKLSPKRQQVLYSLAATKMQLNKVQEAQKILEQTIDDNPKIGESYWRLAYLYKSAGNLPKASETIANARKLNIKFTLQEEGIIGNIIPPAVNPNVKK